jgi:mRNA interferase MazF
MAITSQIRLPLGFAEALVSDWQAAGLIKPSVLKPVLTTIEQGMVIRAMGQLSVSDLTALRQVIAQGIG